MRSPRPRSTAWLPARVGSFPGLPNRIASVINHRMRLLLLLLMVARVSL
jgi:hypothetical protein